MARRSLPLADPFGPHDVARAATATLGAMLTGKGSVRATLDAAESAESWSDELGARVKLRLVPKRPIACASGCAHCCRLKVLVTAPEAIRLAEHLRAGLAPEELEEVRARVRRTDEQTRGATVDARLALALPCPLLVAERCVAYEARPTSCRGSNSYDAAACARGLERGDDPVPGYVPEQQINEALRAALSSAATMNRRDGRLLELVAALRIALDQPGAGEAWSKGRAVFQPAVDAEAEAVLRGLRG